MSGGDPIALESHKALATWALIGIGFSLIASMFAFLTSAIAIYITAQGNIETLERNRGIIGILFTTVMSILLVAIVLATNASLKKRLRERSKRVNDREKEFLASIDQDTTRLEEGQ